MSTVVANLDELAALFIAKAREASSLAQYGNPGMRGIASAWATASEITRRTTLRDWVRDAERLAAAEKALRLLTDTLESLGDHAALVRIGRAALGKPDER